MELSWTQFIFELINFLVLIWILQHFLYKPVQKAIAKRQNKMNEELDKAQHLFDDAQRKQSDYENRLKDWETEKEEMRKHFREKIDTWESKERVKFKKELDKEQEKMQARQEQLLASEIKNSEKLALRSARQFAAKLLESLADASLEKKIIKKTMQDLQSHTQIKQAIASKPLQDDTMICVETAYEVGDKDKKMIRDMLQTLFEKKVQLSFSQVPELIAGLNIDLGTYSIQANLRDELAFFSEIEHEPH